MATDETRDKEPTGESLETKLSDELREYGPIQLLVATFSEPTFTGEILSEVRIMQEFGLVRVLDLDFIYKDEAGTVVAYEETEMGDEERLQFGALVGSLVGYGAGGEEGAALGALEGALSVAEHDFGLGLEDIEATIETLPNDTAAAALLVEHLWARDFRDAVLDAGGDIVAQGFLKPEALVTIGRELAAHEPPAVEEL
ncbi:hypothetical protein ACFQJC_12890 [Haloferax namakaokahaiae]|uniref:DUF1269 domain-containing protein n=1 Tax=Haloferax namakaokahaiae TaxID=1748331 RepID=A0ABD5ZHA0_9EURY